MRCGDCCKEYLLAFSCKGRWFCPSCHAKKVVQFGDVLHETILYPVPHRHYVFSIPIMLRIYFKHDRALLTKLCQCAYHSLLIFLQNVIGLQDGVPGVVLSLHTFGDYPEKFHPHIHAIASDGLFRKTGAFSVMPDVDLKPLEEIFRAKVFNMLKEEGKIDDDIINNTNPDASHQSNGAIVSKRSMRQTRYAVQSVVGKFTQLDIAMLQID